MKINDYQQNKSVYTTKAVAKEHAPVLYVSLDEDEDFQIFGDEDPNTNNAMIISLDQILSIHPDLSQLPDINKGQAYIRESEKAPWEIYKQ